MTKLTSKAVQAARQEPQRAHKASSLPFTTVQLLQLTLAALGRVGPDLQVPDAGGQAIQEVRLRLRLVAT